ncbi:ABC transporter permease [Halobacteria archaeon AArc-dxtr1]|nr:ABC transporter permease [Halobacteria archaeon AArc-dxtr1]
MDIGLVAGVVALGIVHGVLPDHGWPIAALYALERPRQWLQGTVAALVLGIGHLISSVALVLAYYWFSSFAAFAEGPWMKPLAGGLLIALGVYELVWGGHSHDHDDHGHSTDDHGHDHDDHGHGTDDHGHDHDDHEHHHDHDSQHDHNHDTDGGPGLDGGHGHFTSAHAEGGLWTLGVTALVLGFAHEEPIQILAICAGTPFCLELMLIYSLAVIVAILVPTLLLIAGYQTHRERIERYTPYLPTLTGIVLIGVGLGFVLGLF